MHSAVSQSYLKNLPSLNLWCRSRSLVKSQILRGESSSAAVFTAAVPRRICYTNMPSNFKRQTFNKGIKRAGSLCIQGRLKNGKCIACVNVVKELFEGKRMQMYSDAHRHASDTPSLCDGPRWWWEASDLLKCITIEYKFSLLIGCDDL